MEDTHNLPNLTQIAALIRATPALLRRELEAMGVEAARWQPAPGEWCINQVIGHLIEADRHGFHGRVQTILVEGHPHLKTWDIAGIVAQRRDCERDTFELLDELTARRAESAQMVTNLSPGQLQRSGIHPLVGELRVVDLIHEWIHHDRNHIKQILSNVQAFVWPNMGNAQRFFEIFTPPAPGNT
jgi:hypothetical protein